MGALDSTVSLGLNVPYIDVDLGHGVPRIGVDNQFTANPANYYWGFTMDHQDDNTADEVAWRADLKHSFDSNVFDSVKFGVRVTDRDAHSIDTGYDWQPVFQPWMQGWALPGGALPGLDLNAAPPVVILMVGLHGSGKTTSTAKLGKLLKNRGYRPFVAACDGHNLSS